MKNQKIGNKLKFAESAFLARLPGDCDAVLPVLLIYAKAGEGSSEEFLREMTQKRKEGIIPSTGARFLA